MHLDPRVASSPKSTAKPSMVLETSSKSRSPGERLLHVHEQLAQRTSGAGRAKLVDILWATLVVPLDDTQFLTGTSDRSIQRT